MKMRDTSDTTKATRGDRFADYVPIGRTLNQILRLSSHRSADSDGEELWRLWYSTVSDGKQRIFRRRLQMGGLEPERIKEITKKAKNGLLQRASTTLQSLLRVEGVRKPLASDNGTNELPIRALFNEIFGEYLSRFRLKVESEYPDVIPAISSMVDRLFERFCLITTKVLVHEFRAFKLRRSTGQILAGATLNSPSANEELAREFLSSLVAQGSGCIREAYPVWGTFVESEGERWESFFLEILSRWERDKRKIYETFKLSDQDTIVKIRSGGDSHREGRTVCIVEFSSGAKVVYKPRSLALDAWYRDFLEWISLQESISLDLQAPRVIDAGEYGWSAFISHFDCEEPEAEERYYRRMGMLVGIWMFFGGGDCHWENVIASGEHPCVIDIETLFNGLGGFTRGQRDRTSVDIGYRILLESAKSTGSLPSYRQPNQKVKPFDVSAIGVRTPFRTPFTQRDGDRTDCLALDLMSGQTSQRPSHPNVPRAHDKPLRGSLSEAIQRGFEEVYDFFLRERTSVIGRLRRLKRHPEIRIRWLIRNTNLYARLITQSLSPACLRDAAHRSVQIDRLSKRYTQQAFSELNAQILQAELEAIEVLDVPLLDVPLFASRQGRPVCDTSGKLSKAVNGNPLSAAIRRIQRACREDKELQLRLVRETLALDDAIKFGMTGSAPRRAVGAPGQEREISSREAWKVVGEIEECLLKSSLRARDGGLVWIGPAPVSIYGHHEHHVLGHGLYGGSGGVAMFFAAVFRATGEPRYKALAEACLKPLRRVMARPSLCSPEQQLELVRDSYALSVCERLLGNRELGAAAVSYISKIKSEIFTADTSFDVLGGSAGAILSLLSFRDRASDGSLMALAQKAGDYLLTARAQTSTGLRAWSTIDVPLLGFAHGASGTALALHRLAQASDNSSYAEAAEEALAYERSLYEPTQLNWPDLRDAAEGGSVNYDACGWCHGGTGIGIAHVGLTEMIDKEVARAQIAHARKASLSIAQSSSVNFCCGALGRAMFFDMLHRRHGDVEAAGIRDSFIASIINTPLSEVLLIPRVSEPVNLPGLFNGIAGIGYELVRTYIEPEIPVFGLWE